MSTVWLLIVVYFAFVYIVNTIDTDDFKMSGRDKRITLKRVNIQHYKHAPRVAQSGLPLPCWMMLMQQLLSRSCQQARTHPTCSLSGTASCR